MMTEVLRQLTTSAAFVILHENLEKWLMLYEKNTCNENIATGCELVELNARLQGQLFKLLSICAAEGTAYDGFGAIKSRLLPLFGSGLFAPGFGVPTNLSVATENIPENKSHQTHHEKSSARMRHEPGATQYELRRSRAAMEDTKSEENHRKHLPRDSTRDKDLQDLQFKLKSLEQENERLQSKLMQADQDARKSTASTGIVTQKALNSLDVYPMEQLSTSTLAQLNGISPLSTHDPIQRGRQQLVVMRFNELFSEGRIEAMALLRRYLDDHDMNQSIIFHAIVESFNVARAQFRAYRNRIRSRLSSKTNPPSSETLDELVQSHINVHASFAADLPNMTQEVLLAMEHHVPQIRRPSEALGFGIISDFIQEACKLAWECSILAHPIDVYRPACVNEVIDDSKYRRSHDSLYSAVLVHHHIWPCLVQDGSVIAKGEVCTRRGRQTYSAKDTSPETRQSSANRKTHCNTHSCSPQRNSASQTEEDSGVKCNPR